MFLRALRSTSATAQRCTSPISARNFASGCRPGWRSIIDTAGPIRKWRRPTHQWALLEPDANEGDDNGGG
jgi:hypothetical protein